MEWAQWVFVGVVAVRLVLGLIAIGVVVSGTKPEQPKPKTTRDQAQDVFASVAVTCLLAVFLYLAGAFSHIF